MAKQSFSCLSAVSLSVPVSGVVICTSSSLCLDRCGLPTRLWFQPEGLDGTSPLKHDVWQVNYKGVHGGKTVLKSQNLWPPFSLPYTTLPYTCRGFPGALVRLRVVMPRNAKKEETGEGKVKISY